MLKTGGIFKTGGIKNRWNLFLNKKTGGIIPPVPPVSGGEKTPCIVSYCTMKKETLMTFTFSGKKMCFYYKKNEKNREKNQKKMRKNPNKNSLGFQKNSFGFLAPKKSLGFLFLRFF